jgi:hypothetical protein
MQHEVKPLTQEQAAALLGVTSRRLRQIEAESPGSIARAGGTGGYPPAAFAAFLRSRWSAGNGDTAPLSPQAERAALDRARREEIETRLAVQRRELLRARDFESALAGAFKVVSGTLEGLPDELERDCGIDAQTVTKCISVIDRLREDMVRRLQSATGE